jgi:hypothetical protein
MSENANEVQDPSEPKRVEQTVETHEVQPEPEQDAGVEVRTETVVEPSESDDSSEN